MVFTVEGFPSPANKIALNYVWAGRVRVLSLAAGLDTPPGLCPASHATNG